ncbi:MAG: glycosyl hydrolase [Bacteroidota bacterium]|nr:glycosyl hydrolase [Bacteroidota bacterium]
MNKSVCAQTFALRIIQLAIIVMISLPVMAQKIKDKKPLPGATTSKEKKTGFDTLDLSGLKFRSIGPSIVSGRISEFAVDPNNHSRYFVAASAGGVWRTINAGNTFEPVFDGEGSYSIGTIVMDPNNSSVLWVGSGENNNQRSVGYGDGVYKSTDGGNTWSNMGLKESEHIGRIIVHPSNSNIIYVAAIGPLWSSGGDRGLYVTKDGGKTWNKTLNIDVHTGVNDVVMDPRNPDVLYASSFQRRRHVFTYLGGGPQSSIYKSVDGGMTWEKSASGLPSVDIGRIGLAISPADPEIIYAIVEAAKGKGGTFRSNNRGASWDKMSDYHSAGNYYQELIPDPKIPNRLYAMDTWLQVSNDGGKSWNHYGEDFKHIDNHAIWIDPDNGNHTLVGCDGGVYETWDNAKNWHFKSNLPITQFYKVSVDNAEPFYNIYGGTQDNYSLGGPSRTTSGNGIGNEQWFVTHGGDGFETQIDPQNPDIVYAQSQYGVLVRYDKKTGEELGIQPHERKGEDIYRWNWDSPLAVSHHVPGRIYFAANKLFVSDDRGNNWQVISDDLTRQIDRNKLKVMGRVWSIDAVAKNQSTSPYGNIVAFAESPVNADLLFVGTDDGLIQVTKDRGKTWTKVDNIPGAPDTSYVNMIIASAHNQNVVYACFNHHKYGDFKPYLFVSRDQGKTWNAITDGLPARGSVYSIAEDHIDPELLFVGTEFSCFISNNGGKKWRKFANGLPTVAVRDIAIQERENDLVLATFGRGFYVMDDYSSLRNLKENDLTKESMILPIRDAYVFESNHPLGLPGKAFQGDSYYIGENLGSKAIFTFYLKDKVATANDKRIKEEDRLAKSDEDSPYPTYEQLVTEREEDKAKIYLTISDANGNIVRKLTTGADKAGVQRIAWDLRTAPKDPVNNNVSTFYNPFGGKEEGPLVGTGIYTASLSRWQNGTMTSLSQPISFKVKAVSNQTIPTKDVSATLAFKHKVENLDRIQQSASTAMRNALSEIELIKKAVAQMEQSEDKWISEIVAIEKKLKDLQRRMSGDPLKTQLDMDPSPTVSDRIGRILGENKYSSADPTGTHQASLKIAEEELAALIPELKAVLEKDLVELRARLQQAGAPYTPNAIPIFNKQ